MHRKLFTSPIFIILIVFVISGCKKYPEGGNMFALSKTEKRILGSYTIIGLKVDGVDSSLTGNSNFCSGTQISFSSGGFENAKKLNSNCGSFPNNSWFVTGDKKQVVITFSNTVSVGELYPIVINKDVTVTWNIQRLTKDNLWLKTNLNEREYYLKLQYFH